MAKIAIITNARLTQTQGTPGKSLLVDIEHHGSDNSELFQMPGFFSMPQDGVTGTVIDCGGGNNIIVSAHDYNFNEDIEKGETLIYSYDSAGVIKGKILINEDGEIIINDGTKSAVSYAELNTALQLMVTAFNTALASKLDGGGSTGAVTLDISLSEVTEVKLP